MSQNPRFLEHRDKPVCPWCGHLATSLFGGEGERLHVCHGCERVYWVNRHVKVTYSTRKP